MVDPYQPPPGDLGAPPGDDSRKRSPVGWIVATVLLVAAGSVLLVIALTAGGEETTAASDSASSTSETSIAGSEPTDTSSETTAAAADTTETTEPTGSDDSGDPDGGDLDPAGGDPDPGADDPEGGDPGGDDPGGGEPGPDLSDPGWLGVLVVGSGGPIGPVTDVVGMWDRHEFADHYTLEWYWETAGDSYGEEELVPGDVYENFWRAPCGAHLEVTVVPRGPAGEELTRGRGTTRLDECPPTVVPPSNISASPYIGHNVRFGWTPGSGYDRYYWEAYVSHPPTGETLTGHLDNPNQPHMTLDASCGHSLDFTLVALMADGTEVGRLSHSYEAAPCPGVFVVEGPSTAVPANRSAGEPALCPAGSTVVGGGFWTPEGSLEMDYPGWVFASHPIEDGWFASVAAPPERSLSLRPYALCMAHEESEMVTVASASIRPDSLDSVVAECPHGTAVSGGGFATGDIGLNVLVSAPDGNGWRVTGWNPLSTNASFRAYAVCVEGQYINTREVSDSVSVADGGFGPGTSQSCPVGSVLTSGGFASPDAFFEASYPLDGSWRVRGHNRQFLGPAGPDVLVEATAVCQVFPP